MINTDYKYSLERGSKKVNCPNCMKKTFVRYVNNETGEHLSPEYGRCDREQKCGYFLQPENEVATVSNYMPVEKPKPTFIELTFLDYYFNMKAKKQNRFVKFLYSHFPQKEVDRVVQDYVISTCFRWGGGATIFWQIDEKENVRSGQVILYDEVTGKRVKEPFNHVTWVHSILEKRGKLKNFVLEQCLFGLHLITQQPEKDLIAVVESPKTACIMSLLFPKYIWLATCGLSNLKPETLRPLKQKKVVLYPDLGAFDKWQEKAELLKKYGYSIETSELLENNCPASHAGLDIADYFINQSKIKTNE